MEKIKKTTKTKTVDKTEEIKKIVETKKTKRQINMELRKKQDEIYVEICNMSFMSVIYMNKNEETYFDLYPNEYTELPLSELYEVATKNKSYFKDYMLAITDVLSDEYTIDNIIDYLGITSIYNSEENQFAMQIDSILNLSDDVFEREIEGRSNKFIRNLACKAILLTKSEESDYELSRKKERVLCRKLGREQLIDIDE